MRKLYIALLAALLTFSTGHALEVYDWDNSAANNNSSPPNGFPENMQYSAVNNAAREVMAVVARYFDAVEGIQTAGTSNAYTLTVAQTLSAYAEGQLFLFEADRANTGAVTLNVNALGAVAVVDTYGNALVADDIVVGGRYMAQHDGTDLHLINFEGFSAADNTKLTGIETSATADQTDAEIRTAVEAATDSNVFTDADHTKLDGLDVPLFVRAASNETVTSNAVNQDDDELTFASVPTGRYLVDGVIVWREDATVSGQGFRYDFDGGTLTATEVDFKDIATLDTGGSTVFFSADTDLTTDRTGGTFGTIYSHIAVRGTMNVTVTGSFTFRFAQNASNANGTTRLANSWLRLSVLE